MSKASRLWKGSCRQVVQISALAQLDSILLSLALQLIICLSGPLHGPYPQLMPRHCCELCAWHFVW
jgi:hypothetical protein